MFSAWINSNGGLLFFCSAYLTGLLCLSHFELSNCQKHFIRNNNYFKCYRDNLRSCYISSISSVWLNSVCQCLLLFFAFSLWYQDISKRKKEKKTINNKEKNNNNNKEKEKKKKHQNEKKMYFTLSCQFTCNDNNWKKKRSFSWLPSTDRDPIERNQ